MRSHKSALARGEGQNGCGRAFASDDTRNAKTSQANDRAQSESDVNASAARIEPDRASAASGHFDKRRDQLMLFVGKVAVDRDFPVMSLRCRIERPGMNG